MPIRSLPANPDIEQLRKLAKTLQRLVRAGDRGAVDLHQDTRRGTQPPSVAMTWGRSTVVRMPGAAAQTTGTALTARCAV